MDEAEPGSGALQHAERLRLEALRYAARDEAPVYIAIMRTFTGEIAGLLSDQSATEVAQRLAEQGFELGADTVDDRLSYLVEHGNLARSPRETEARSLREYLQNRARYQLTQRGELVHRFVEELLGHTESAREVSTEMLGGILAGLLSLGRLLDYLQRFVDEVARHMPQLADALERMTPQVPALCARANAGQRLLGVDGEIARRAKGLDPADWGSLYAWFIGSAGRDSDAAGVRRLATDAMRALLVNLRRIATGRREQSRYGDLLTLARWFAEADDGTAHALWASAFGLYSCRHLGFPADDDADPVPPTASWWRTPSAEVPVALRQYGARTIRGRSGRRDDYAVAKAARLAEREQTEQQRSEALSEIAVHTGNLGTIKLSDDARGVLLDLYARALVGRGRPLGPGASAQVEVGGEAWRLVVRRTPGAGTVITSPAGRMELQDLTLAVEDVPAQRERRATG